jgi:hypothetical protein
MKKIYAFLAFAVALFVAGPALAAAVSPNEVQIIPPEYFQAGFLGAVASAIAAAVWALVERFLGPLSVLAKIARVDQMFGKYIQGGLVKLSAEYPQLATKGLTVSVGNAFVASIANDLLKVIPGWMLRFVGGKEAVIDKVRNRLPEVLRDLKLPPIPIPG